jgi:hybrid cluster-associated redox disulfide protein
MPITQITKHMTIEEVVQRYPETVQVFSRYGVGCLGCSAAQYDNVEQGAAIHGLDAEQLVKELNACISAGDKGN